MAYNTGNPIGSTDPRDAADNKENFDRFVLSTDRTYTDRLGIQRKTVTGALQDYAAYNLRGLWTTATAYNVNDVWRDGSAGAFYLVLDDYTSGATAAADIAGGNVVVHQPKDWVVSVATIADLRAMEPAFDGQQAELLGHTVAGVGGGVFYADYSSSAADDNGVTVVTVGGRRWVRRFDGFVTPLMFGASGDGVLDDTIEVQLAADAAAATGCAVTLGGRTYKCNQQIILATGTTIQGPGKLMAGPIAGFPTDTHLGFIYADSKSRIKIDGVTVDTSQWTSLPTGVASVRAILFRKGSDLEVTDCNLVTTGGGVAFIGCKDIEVSSNEITITPVAGVSSGYADGVIDVWVEFGIDAERCIISNNRIKGAGFGRWGVMVTALTYQAQIMEVSSVNITGNVIEDVYYDGIWAFGRNSGLYGLVISGNVIKKARKGISVSDAAGFSVCGNTITDTQVSGIHLWTETAGGGTLGATGGVVSGNALRDVAQVDGQPIAIWIADTSSRNTISGNTVSGATHYFGLVVSDTALYNEIAANNIQAGRGAKYLVSNDKTKYLGNNCTLTAAGMNNVTSVTLQAARAHITGDTAFVFFRLSVTPTNASTYTRITLSLPYASSVSTYSLFGGAVQETGESAFVLDYPAESTASIAFTPSTNAVRNISGWFSYQLID